MCWQLVVILNRTGPTVWTAVSAFLAVSALCGRISLFGCISQELCTALLPLLSADDAETAVFDHVLESEAPQPKTRRKVATMHYIVAV